TTRVTLGSSSTYCGMSVASHVWLRTCRNTETSSVLASARLRLPITALPGTSSKRPDSNTQVSPSMRIAPVARSSSLQRSRASPCDGSPESSPRRSMCARIVSCSARNCSGSSTCPMTHAGNARSSRMVVPERSGGGRCLLLAGGDREAPGLDDLVRERRGHRHRLGGRLRLDADRERVVLGRLHLARGIVGDRHVEVFA